ncbi:hypothetical protein MUK42_06610 [Musa troglodytarum]|uniref:Uncharacterized protein n=1 Tax=Musa troglodytarum TaxID=320322 RepID=A0A9E7JF02_9LILI|nr:hypothetical protein MUK42_06610 [Musa troglodytarum]
MLVEVLVSGPKSVDMDVSVSLAKLEEAYKPEKQTKAAIWQAFKPETGNQENYVPFRLSSKSRGSWWNCSQACCKRCHYGSWVPLPCHLCTYGGGLGTVALLEGFKQARRRCLQHFGVYSDSIQVITAQTTDTAGGRPGSDRAEPSPTEPSRAEPIRAEPSRAERSRAEPNGAELGQVEPSRTEPSRASRAGRAGQDRSKIVTGRAGPSRRPGLAAGSSRS